MKSLLKSMLYLFVDKYAFDTNTPIWKRFILTTKYKLAARGLFLSENERKIRNLKDKHIGKRCFIIGNGPSLNLLDLTKLKDEFTFGVNAIYLNYERMKFHPTYYVVEDNLVAEDRAEEINNYRGPVMKLYGAYLNYVLKKDENSVYLNLLRNYADKKRFPLFSRNALRKLYVGGTVTYVCLELAHYMGFKEVYMIGFDHNYKIPDSAIVTNRRETGFDIESTEDDPNHFAPSYFGKGYRWHDPNVERMEVGFKKANSEYQNSGRKIYNATIGGHLETFERINYNDLFV